MPAIVVAAGASLAAEALVGAAAGAILGEAAGTAFVGSLWGKAAVAVSGGLIAAAGNSVLGGRPDAAPTSNFDNTAKGALVTVGGNDEPIPVIYGSRRVGGVYALREITGADNEYLQMVIVWSEGPIEGIDDILLDGVSYDDPRWVNRIQVEHRLGSDTQTAFAGLMAEMPGRWTANHTLAGLACTWLQFNWSADVFPQGLPQITADIRGRTVYDPRTATTAFSNNAALCLRDYLSNPRYGRGIDTAYLPDAAWSDAADACDVTISTPAGSIAKYTCDGLVNTDAQIIDNVRSLLTACRGALVRSGADYRLVVDQAETASGFDFNEDNIVGAWVIRPAGKRDKFNRVAAKYFNASGEWQPDYAVWESTTDRTADNDLVLEAEVALPFTSNFYRAQYIAQLEQRQSRYGIVCQFRATLAGLDCEVGDVVTITHSTPAWTAKPFRVLRMDILSSDEVEVTAREYQASVYTTDTLDTAPVVAASNLPRVWEVAAPGTPTVGEDLYESTAARRVQAVMLIEWAAAADAFVREYEVQYKLAAAADWTTLPRTGGLTAQVLDIAPGTYSVRVRAVNSVSVSSAWSATTTREILGLSAQPQAITGLTIQKIGSQAILTFDQSADLDVRRGGRILVRHSEAVSGATWEASFSIGNERGVPGDAVFALVPLKAGTYLVKAEDTSGQQSATAATVASDGATVLAFAAVSNVTEDSAFAGYFNNTVLDAGTLKLAGLGLFDDITSLDAISDVDGYGGLASSGSYWFAAGLDFTTPRRVQLYSMLEGLVENTNDLLDDRTATVDDWLDWDGTAGGAADAWVECASTDDAPDDYVDPDYWADDYAGPGWSEWQRLDRSEFYARAHKFRARLTANDPAYNISLNTLRVYAQEL
jgi:hypothetical protein